jgi:hypothetical protein
MIGILLTVPHGGPGNDTGAAPVAKALHRLLRRAGLEVRTIINRQPREDVDMNRPVGRGSAFRNAIGVLVQKDTVGLFIDVHSFPAGDTRFGDRDIVLLSTEDIQEPAFYRRYVELLREGAEKLGCADVDVAVMPAEYVDDVVIHANELGQPPSRLMLVEHNADGPADLYAGMHLYAIGAIFGAEEVEPAEYVDEDESEQPTVKVGDIVTRRGGTMRGEVLAVTPGRYSGGSRASVKVRWITGHISILADQQLLVMDDDGPHEEDVAEPRTGVQMGKPSVINKPFDFRHEPHAPDSRSVAKTDPTGYHGQHLPKGSEIKLATGATKKGERRTKARRR